MPIPKKAKRDKNEPDIVDALIRVGATVQRLSESDTPDLVVGFRGVNYLIEVKDKGNKLSSGQVNWHQNWRGQVNTVYTVDEVLRLIEAIS